MLTIWRKNSNSTKNNIILVSSNIQDLQQGVVERACTLDEEDMKINITKSKIIMIGKDKKIKIQWKHEELEPANRMSRYNSFQYKHNGWRN